MCSGIVCVVGDFPVSQSHPGKIERASRKGYGRGDRIIEDEALLGSRRCAQISIEEKEVRVDVLGGVWSASTRLEDEVRNYLIGGTTSGSHPCSVTAYIGCQHMVQNRACRDLKGGSDKSGSGSHIRSRKNPCICKRSGAVLKEFSRRRIKTGNGVIY